MKKILIINGHPSKSSFCQSIAKAYQAGATSKGNQVVLLNLHELNFNFNLSDGYSKTSVLEADLVLAQEKIKWAQHLVIIHPVWWGSVPALLKGFFDKTLLPGFAFSYRQSGMLWDKLLSGKTAEIIYTSDTPVWIYRFFYRAPSVTTLRDRILGFCGVKTLSIIGIGSIRKSTHEFRKNWLLKVEKRARNFS